MANEWKYAKTITGAARAWENVNPAKQDSIWGSFGGPLLDQVEDGAIELAKQSGLSVLDAAGLIVATLFDRLDNQAHGISRKGCTSSGNPAPDLPEDNIVEQINWRISDVKVALVQAGFKDTPENIKRLLDNRFSRTLREQSISEGWDIISEIIDGTDGLALLEESNEDPEEATYICCNCEHEQIGGNNCEKCGSDKLEHIDAYQNEGVAK
ncbi:hypothetical protein [Paenibacillus abyssi]|uniref:Uncharacterized protein n=1 Tax=Paenibacillus abyssi TaxID=1340531 RepID=A0A917LFJ2_9BACL|nr:hypothetical protein [Paenibacillus abyssi]GGG18395.1 hypothetical protein GCM10010916_39040 [Paenibacillus abyssi]